MKILYMLIGCAGSGKSTYTNDLIEHYKKEELDDQDIVVCSTDALFIKHGVYTFNPGRLELYHALNFKKAALAMAYTTKVVIVDNTNLKQSFRQPYEDIARATGYHIKYVIVGAFTEEAARFYYKSNIHSVPLESVIRMCQQVELPVEGDIIYAEGSYQPCALDQAT